MRDEKHIKTKKENMIVLFDTIEIDHSQTAKRLIAKYHTSVDSSCDYICKICNQLWFKDQIYKNNNLNSRYYDSLNILDCDVISTDKAKKSCHVED